MTLAVKDFILLAGTLITITIAIGLALVYFLSRFRRESDKLRAESDKLREDYILGLERDRIELRSDKVDLEKVIHTLKSESSELRGQVRVLQDLVLNGHCRSFSKDPTTGGCGHCFLGLPPLPRVPEPE